MLCFSCASFIFSLNLIWFCFVGKKFLCNFLIFFSLGGSFSSSGCCCCYCYCSGVCVCVLWAVSGGVWAWDVDAAAALGFVCLLCAQLWWILLGSSYCREWVILFGAGFVCAWVCVFVCVPSGQTHLFLLLFGLFCMWGGTLFCFSSEKTNGGGGKFAKKKNWDCVRACVRVFLGVWLGAENYWWWWWCSVLDNRSFWL